MIKPHNEYAVAMPYLKRIRAAIAGEAFVKLLKRDALPYPSVIDDNSVESRELYAKYLATAEFDEFPKKTMDSLVGRMKVSDTLVELPAKIEYLEDDSDGDGLSLRGAMSKAIEDILQAKWRVLVADYQGLSDVDISSVSVADLKQLNPRATIKSYTRENVVQWHYTRINGRLQLAFLMLMEVGSEFDTVSYQHNEVKSYLILALDEYGNYYQQKIVENASGTSYGKKTYIEMGTQKAKLKWLPVQIVSDSELPSGSMPTGFGYLSPIVDKAYHSYIVSADYKEALRNLCPTINTSGWTEQKHALFVKMNNRNFIATGSGAVNNLPEGVTTDIIGGNTGFEGYQWYFENHSSKVRALGGSFKDNTDAQKTATEAGIDASEQNAMLDTLAQSIEAAFSRICLYCGMFEGLWPQEAIEDNLDQITIDLPRDFASQKITPDEQRVIIETYMAGLYTKEQAIQMLVLGGAAPDDAGTMIANAENSGVSLPISK
jgi:hypothetical protein